MNLETDRSLALLDEIADLTIIRELALHVEIAAGRKPGDEFAALLAMVQIEDHGGDMVDLESGGVAEHQHLDYRRAEEQKTSALVAEDLDELFDQHLFQAG